ncbi:MAG: HAD-IB family phosphatase [Candidatus Bathyarchaeia archaeon]
MPQTCLDRKLVVFDVEGVLLPKNRYLAFEMGRNLSFARFIKLFFIGFLYEMRILSLESTLKRIFNLFQGLTVEELLATFREVPLLPHTEATFVEMREKGLKTALISSGLPQIIVEDLALRLEAGYSFGLELETIDDVLTGKINGDVIKNKGKAKIMEKILDQEKLSKRDCVVVADDRNNAPIFYPETLKIGYNPDFLIAFKSDYVIKENLLEIVSILEGIQKRPSYSLSRSEIIREAIHAGGFFVAWAAARFGVRPIVVILLLTILIYTASELARAERTNMPPISSITLRAATLSERYEFATTPIFLALGVMFALLFFPTPINYASIAIVCFGDSAASIFGKLFGKTPIPFNKGKNLEGSLSGLLFAFLGASFFLHPLQAFIGAIIGMLIECSPLPINDNLSIPLVTGALLTLLTILS